MGALRTLVFIFFFNLKTSALVSLKRTFHAQRAQSNLHPESPLSDFGCAQMVGGGVSRRAVNDGARDRAARAIRSSGKKRRRQLA